MCWLETLDTRKHDGNTSWTITCSNQMAVPSFFSIRMHINLRNRVKLRHRRAGKTRLKFHDVVRHFQRLYSIVRHLFDMFDNYFTRFFFVWLWIKLFFRCLIVWLLGVNTYSSSTEPLLNISSVHFQEYFIKTQLNTQFIAIKT